MFPIGSALETEVWPVAQKAKVRVTWLMAAVNVMFTEAIHWIRVVISGQNNAALPEITPYLIIISVIVPLQ